jgi:hypothetical protein
MRLYHAFLIAMAVTACAPSPVESEERVASAAQPSQIACSDPQGCPDLIPSEFWLKAGMMLDTRKFKRSSCPVQEDLVRPGNRRLLRMSLAVINVGPGELDVGAATDHPDLFHFNECYDTYQFRDADALRLWRPVDYAIWVALRAANPSTSSEALLDAHPLLRHRIIAGRKNHFCLGEYFHCEPVMGCPADQTIAPSTHQAADPDTCSINQGLSVGWMDVYPIYVDGQWIEVPSHGGTFILEQDINTERVLEESDYTNNSVATCVNIPPKNGHHHFVPDPSCITPPQFEEATNCEMCLEVCAAIADAGAQQSGCPCEPYFCPDPPP